MATPIITFSTVDFCYERKVVNDNSLKSLITSPRRFLTSSRHELSIFEGLSFDIYEGERVGIIGSNGSGKTTLLRLIVQVLQPTAGNVTVNGNISPLASLAFAINGNYSVHEAITLYFIYRGLDRKEARNMAVEVLKKSYLENYRNAFLSALSSGMLARLNFYMAISINTDIVLFDEIQAVGDLQFATRSKKDLRNFLDLGKTLVTVSHDLDFLLGVTNRCLWIKGGRMFMDGPSVEVIGEYRAFFKL